MHCQKWTTTVSADGGPTSRLYPESFSCLTPERNLAKLFIFGNTDIYRQPYQDQQKLLTDIWNSRMKENLPLTHNLLN